MKNRLTLKARLVISFCIIIFVPFLLAMVMMQGVNQIRQLNMVEEESVDYGDYTESLRLLEKYGKDQGPFLGICNLLTSDETPREVKKIVWDMIISIFLILIFTAAILIGWSYSGIVPELRYLVQAADRMREGDLEQPIVSSGSNEFSELSASLEAMRKRLKANTEEKLAYEEQQRQLISNIAHDLKTPITAIKGYSEGLMDGVAKTPEKQQAYLRTIYNKANEMNALINELSLYSKIDTNRIPYNFQPVNVEAYFMDCAEELGMELKTQQIEFLYSNFTSSDTQIIADPEQLERVIHNIVSNSVKYRGSQTHLVITMRLQDVGDFIQVELGDNGMGIETKDLPHIFDRMYRADASRNSSTGGSGIGLSIVKKIIEDHGGNIWVTSKMGEGTTMYFVIRKYQEVMQDE